MRLFVALDITDDLRNQLSSLSIGSLRTINAQHMHLTLKYLGEVPQERLKRVVGALSEVSFSPFSLSTTKIGSFDTVLWLGVKLTKHLAQLQQDVARAVRPFTTHDPRPFKPHITIARFGELSSNQYEQISLLLKKRIEKKWSVNRFFLMRSDLQEDGPIYTVVHEFRC